MAVPVALRDERHHTAELRDGRELKSGSSERVVMQRDTAIRAEFRVLVRQNFGGFVVRCLVSIWGVRAGGCARRRCRSRLLQRRQRYPAVADTAQAV